MMDYGEDPARSPSVQTHSLREFEQHLNDLKKENFSLKLRIYFLEEKIQQKFEESSDAVHKTNIELKVQVESLKKDLEEKEELLDKTLSAAENLTNQNEAELQRRLEERQQEISHMQEILEAKVQLLQEEAELARDEAQRMAERADAEAQRRRALEREMEMEGTGAGDGVTLTHQNHQNYQNHPPGRPVEELEVKVHDLSSSLRTPDDQQPMEQPDRYQSDLQLQNQVRSLQNQVRQSEARNQDLQQQLDQNQLDLSSARDQARNQERVNQNLADAAGTREAEAAELYRVVDEQNQMLCSLKQLADRSQLQVSGAEPGPCEVLALQASLFQAQLELQAAQRAQQRSTRAREDQNRALGRLEDDLQAALQHRRETEQHNQELQVVLTEVRSALQDREDQLGASEQQLHREQEERERTVRDLRTALQSRDQLLQDYRDTPEDPEDQRDALVQKLRQRIKERDRALERAVDEKFCLMKEKDEETRRVHLLLREKDRDLDRQRCVLSNNEETITSLEVLVRGKALELEQVTDAWRSVQRLQRDVEDKQNCILGERDSVIKQLQSALQVQTQEAQDLRRSLLAQIQSAPGGVLEDLRVRVHLKDRLFQDVLADRTRQAQEHQDQVQDLLGTIGSRDRYIKDSASRFSEVLTEQTLRLQELRRQLSSGSGSRTDSGADLSGELQVVQEELQVAQEELQVALRRDQENQELSRGQAVRLDALGRSLHTKDDIIRDLQRQLVDPSELQLVEQLTREVQDMRESLFLQGPTPDHHRSGTGAPEFGELSSEDEEDLKSESMESAGEDESATQIRGEPELSSLTGVKHLVEQKLQVEKELVELKVQLEKAGFSSLSQMRRALFSLRAENHDLKLQMDQDLKPGGEKEEEEEEEEEEEDGWDEGMNLSQQHFQTGGEERRNQPVGEEIQDPATSSAQDVEDAASPAVTVRLQQSSRELQQSSRELQERLMVSEATVQAQAEQLKDYRELLTETTVQQDSKQIQVDLQDLGYETCGRSENEAEREDASSPEFDDLEMCTSLDCGSQWWPSKSGGQSSGEDAPSLRRLVEELRSQLSRAQAVIRGLQGRLRSLSTASDNAPATPRKVNWSFQASSSQTGTDDDEGWQSSDGGALASPRHPGNGLQELVSRVDALEDQLRNGNKKEDKDKSGTWPGKFDTLIQAQARELSHLRQRVREGRGVCSVLTQQLADTTKAFEELLRANDVDYYTGQSFRDLLAQSGALAQQVGAKISGRGRSEDPEEKTELLAIRLSKELQQKDKLIESLRAKLSHRGSDTPCSSHALSDTSDQSDRISYVSDEHGSTHEDLELCSDVDASEPGQDDGQGSARTGTDAHCHHGNMSQLSSAPPSFTSSHGAQSCLSCPSMHCPSSPHTAQTAPVSVCPSYHLPPSSTQKAPLHFHPHGSTLRTRYQGNGSPGFSLAEVQQELQMLQRQLGGSSSFSTPTSRHLQGFPFAPQQPADFLPLSYSGFQPSPFRGVGTGILDHGSAMKAGAGLLESSALWDTTFGARPARVGADLSSGSSGYQSGTNNTGSELMKEHLREIRTLRQRLEDSIQTNDRLRQQLEDRLASAASEKGAPTNIYIQSLDSAGQLSGQIQLLKEENLDLQTRLKEATREGSKEAELLREAVLLEQSRLKEAELTAEKWAGQNSILLGGNEAQAEEINQLRLDRQRKQEAVNRLQHEVVVLQQQLRENQVLVRSLQNQLQDCDSRPGQVTDEDQSELSSTSLNPRELQQQLERRLGGVMGVLGARGPAQLHPAHQQTCSAQAEPRPVDDAPSPPVRDLGLVSPPGPPGPAQGPAQGPADGPRPAAHDDDRHVVAHGNDFAALQQQILGGTALLLKMEATIYSLGATQEPRPHQPGESGVFRNLLSATRALKRILQEADSLLRMFWRTARPESEEPKQDPSLREEVSSLRLQLSEREQALRDATERLKSSNLARDGMEHFILGQLSRTRDVLKKAKTNLQVRTQEASVTSPSLLVGVS